MNVNVKTTRKSNALRAVAIAKLENGKPTVQTAKLLNQYVDGKINVDGMIRELNSHYNQSRP